jgi:hypothetical protein
VSNKEISMNRQAAIRWAAVAASLAAIAVGTTPAHADQVYHAEHLDLASVGGAPLRSGFVQNIKAEGPAVYAHEIFVLNGAGPRATYTFTRNFFPFDPDCTGDNGVFASDVATLTTNPSGNASGDLFVRPEEAAGFEGVHGVKWTVQSAGGALAYQTTCTAVTLD